MVTSTRANPAPTNELRTERKEIERAAGLPVIDTKQEAVVVRRAAEWARKADLPEEDVRHLFWRIVALTRSAQECKR